MPKITCGIFLYDAVNKKLLVTKAYGSRKFEGYSVPKGLFDQDIDESYFSTAEREFKEECGISLEKILGGSENIIITKEFDLVPYENIAKQFKSFLIIAERDLSQLNFECISFFQKEDEPDILGYPEIASYHWMDLVEAKKKLHYTQANLVPKIEKLIEYAN